MSDPTNSSLALRDAIELFRQSEAAERAPYLAVLGPPGCGKSGYLRSLRTALNGHGSPADRLHLSLDLRQLPFQAEEQMYLHLANLSLNGASPGAAMPPALRAGEGPRAFEEVLRGILSARGSLLLYIDNLDCVPRYFARALLRKFRQLYEERNDFEEYRRLGLVLAGSLSLFERKQDTNSILSVCDRVLLPFLDRKIWLERVRERVTALGCEACEPVLNLLAAETGGELAFLEPLLKKVCGERSDLILDQGSVSRAVQEISSLSSSLPMLRDLALHLYDSPDLLEIVRQLDEGVSYVAPRDPTIDIDRFHLMGAVVLDSSNEPPSYGFRNGIVARYCRNTLALPLFRARGVAHRRASRDEAAASSDNGVLQRIDSLERLRQRIHHSSRIWESLSELREAWQLTTLYKGARAEIYVHAYDQIWWWLDSAHRELKERPAGKSDEAAIRAAVAALRERQPAFGLDDHDIAFAIPIARFVPSSPVAFLVVQLSRSEIDGCLSENALVHWTRLVEDLAPALENRAWAEFGRGAFQSRIDTAKPMPLEPAEPEQPPEPPTPREPNLTEKLAAARNKIDQEVDRMLQVARLGVLALSLGLLAAGVYWSTPLVIANFNDLFEPMGLIIQSAFWLFALVATFLGYRFKRFHGWKKIKDRLQPRIVDRRLRRLRRLLE